MDDGREIIAKLPNPNAGRPHFTSASEVAAMDFLRNVLNLPVPRVYAWSSRASENPLGAEYILMEKQAGVVLTNVWDTIKGKQKVQVLDQVVDIERRLAAIKFSKFGSLYYKDDLPGHLDATVILPVMAVQYDKKKNLVDHVNRSLDQEEDFHFMRFEFLQRQNIV
ncbi:hypothetical protein BJX64DRAFT_289811 [Aspergillus heterothallicus]